MPQFISCDRKLNSGTVIKLYGKNLVPLGGIVCSALFIMITLCNKRGIRKRYIFCTENIKYMNTQRIQK